ncbi:MAG TPA: glycerophosphodiester phosphodiesterase [Nitrospirota bacterium]|nr:glycerophosphodiester phosphodiesterase [Nitrospirota bacterium]
MAAKERRERKEKTAQPISLSSLRSFAARGVWNERLRSDGWPRKSAESEKRKGSSIFKNDASMRQMPFFSGILPIMALPLVIAHRGDSYNELENSMAAVRRALAYPVDMIEIDIRRSRDNSLFVMHDASTDRTAERSSTVERSFGREIAGIHLKNGEPVPTLTDVIKAVSGKTGLNIEIKSSGAGHLLAEYLASSDYKGYVLVSSFKEEEVRAVRRMLPALPVSMIFDMFTPKDLPVYSEQGYKIVSLRKTTATPQLVQACHELGIQVYVWTVDAEEEMLKFIEWKVDGIYSNRPGLLKTVVTKNCLEGKE